MLSIAHSFLANHPQVALLIIALLVLALVLSLVTVYSLWRMERKRKLFIRKVNHELRTPLVVIKGGVPLLQEKALGGLNPKQEELIGNIMRSVRKLESVTEKLNFEVKEEFLKI